VWVILWLVSVRPRDLALAPASGSASTASENDPWWSAVANRRFVVTLTVLFCIHTTWQLLRVWLPMFLQTGRGYSEGDALVFNAVYFLATDLGCLGAGAASLWLARRGLDPHRAKVRVYLGCSLLTSLTVLVAILPKGPLLLCLLLLIGAGALGVYPCYYSFVQEISSRHVGKMTGLIATLVWAISSPVHKYFGRHIDQTQSFDLGIALVGLTPLVGFVALLFWSKGRLPTKGTLDKTA
jgi:MFS transporter, ACS family, hexuronate transporter